MSFQTFVTERLAALTAMLNATSNNAKKIDELEPQDTINPASRIHVSIDGVSQRISIQQLIDILNSGNYDMLVSIGEITLDGNEITIPADAVWRISDVYYGNISPIEITIPYCATGLQRKDILVANTSNNIVLVQGDETAGITFRPNIPINTVLVTELDVTDSSVGDPTPPITGDNFVDRFSNQDIEGEKTFRQITKFRSDATDSYTAIFEDFFRFYKNQESEDNGSVSITAVSDVIGDYIQQLQGKDGIIALMEDVDLKVDKVTGKGLSTEDYTTAEKNKVSFITITQAVNLDDIETRVNELDAAVVLKGTWDQTTGVFPGSGVAQAGWSYLVNGVTETTIDGVKFNNGDRIIAVVDNASTSTYASNWYLADYTDRVNTVAGRTGNVVITSSDLSDFNSAVNALITSAISGKENTSNKTGTVVGNEASTSLYLHIAGAIAYFQQKLTDSIFGTFVNSLTSKTTPVDADSISVVDSADSNKQKKVSLTNFKAFFKTYNDNLYSPRYTPVVIISGNTTLDDTHNGKVLLLTGSYTVTLPNGLATNFGVTIATKASCTLTMSLGGSVTLLNNVGTTMAEKLSCTFLNTGNSNEYLTAGTI
ncbi:hypothetical protein [Flavobacterium sp. CF136]|uniref:hypothetical protein n=1 Tax=Flavobacterium sp. (strain CF136) TaxID=1144313 RepID=UPI0002719F20|nr:hypothetical protein [Flavobacterium sp. CF136]EJL66318.1 hypothetical protein PMI10_00666 [Flavobacterium sp. CF136]